MKYAAPLLAYAAFIFFMSALSAPPTPTFSLKWGDKITHAGAYFIMFHLAFRAARWRFPHRALVAHAIVATGFTILFGASDEFHQAFVPGREADVLDWVADSAGALVGVMTIIPLRRSALSRLMHGPAWYNRGPQQEPTP